MSKFTENQINQIRQWIPQMHSISEFQTKLNETFNQHFTYLETRFLLDDLNLEIKKEEPHQPTNESEQPDTTQKSELPASNGVQVNVDPVTRPGMVFNGTVTFSDGQSAQWSLDQLGRLGLKPAQQGYRPSQEDIAAFQESLQQKLSELSQRNAFNL